MADLSSSFDFGVNAVVANWRKHAGKDRAKVTVRELRMRFNVMIVVYAGFGLSRARIVGA